MKLFKLIYPGRLALPARSCLVVAGRARPPSAALQANAGRAWSVGELAMAGGQSQLTCHIQIFKRYNSAT